MKIINSSHLLSIINVIDCLLLNHVIGTEPIMIKFDIEKLEA